MKEMPPDRARAMAMEWSETDCMIAEASGMARRMEGSSPRANRTKGAFSATALGTAALPRQVGDEQVLAEGVRRLGVVEGHCHPPRVLVAIGHGLAREACPLEAPLRGAGLLQADHSAPLEGDHGGILVPCEQQCGKTPEEGYVPDDDPALLPLRALLGKRLHRVQRVEACDCPHLMARACPRISADWAARALPL